MTSIKILALSLALLGNLTATPTRAVSTDEQPVGSNPTQFAILRTETDNLGSYYSYRKKTSLEEFTKENESPAEPRRTLLLDVTYHVDPEHSDPNTTPELKETIHHQDAALHWATILQRYPQRTWTNWTPEQMEKLTVDPVAGIRNSNGVLLLSGDRIQQGVFGGLRPESPWTLVGVSEDANSLYLRLSKVFEDGVHDSRLIAIPPEITKQLRDQALLKPLYLIAGKFNSAQDALTEARALKAKATAEKVHGFHPEIWSVWEPTDKIVYVIAEQFSMELIDRGGVRALEKVLGVELVPVTSKNFRERTLP